MEFYYLSPSRIILERLGGIRRFIGLTNIQEIRGGFDTEKIPECFDPLMLSGPASHFMIPKGLVFSFRIAGYFFFFKHISRTFFFINENSVGPFYMPCPGP